MSPSELVDSIGPHSGAEDVAPLLDEEGTDEAHVLRLLRKREIPSTVIEAIARHERWNARHVIRAAIVMHAKTPRTLALRVLTLLRWRDQLRVATNVRLHMPLRVAAESRLKERYAQLELGEKISIARSAPMGLLPLLAAEESPRVIGALLHNPRLVEADVVAIVRRDKTPGEVLRVVAQSERWTARLEVRLAILRHRSTPVHVALALAGRLSDRELKKLLAKGAIPRVVKLHCERRLAAGRTSESWRKR